MTSRNESSRGKDAMDTMKKLDHIKEDLSKARKALNESYKLGKLLRNLAFITLYEKPTRELVKNYTENMTITE